MDMHYSEYTKYLENLPFSFNIFFRLISVELISVLFLFCRSHIPVPHPNCPSRRTIHTFTALSRMIHHSTPPGSLCSKHSNGVTWAPFFRRRTYTARYIGGFHVTSRRPCWCTLAKEFLLCAPTWLSWPLSFESHRTEGHVSENHLYQRS